MARRRSAGAEISLFPFLSILVCVIGLLTLMIAGSSLTEIQEEADPRDVERTQEYRALQNAIQADQARLMSMDRMREDPSIGLDLLQDVHAKLDDARKRKAERDKTIAEYSPLIAEAADLASQVEGLKRRLAELQSELARRTELITDLDRQIDEKGKPQPAVVSIRPTGTGAGQDAVFVECTDAGIVLLEGEEIRIRTADLGNDRRYLDLLEDVASSADKIVIFLLRDNAADAYWAARKIAEQQGSRHGKIPVIGQGRIDLSPVRKARR